MPSTGMCKGVVLPISWSHVDFFSKSKFNGRVGEAKSGTFQNYEQVRLRVLALDAAGQAAVEADVMPMPTQRLGKGSEPYLQPESPECFCRV